MNPETTSASTDTILVVDDMPANLRLLAKLLTNRGYQVRFAENGKQALQCVQNALPDLILLDIQMPELDGYQVCKLLKSKTQTCDIPIIFLSASDAVVDKVKAFEMGAIDFITKPFEARELLARIEQQLQISKLQKELNQQSEQLTQQNQQLLKQSQALAAFSNSLKQLHRLNMTSFSKVETLFADYIQTGCSVLNFSAGAVGRIQDESYTFLAVQSDIDSLVPNLTVKLSDAYCGKVAERQKTVTLDHVGEMKQMQCHPLYQSLKLESYIGTPIFVNGALYGTLCFFSRQPRLQGFENHEKEIIELMAQSIGKFITTRQTEAELMSLFAAMTDVVIVRDQTGRCLKVAPTSPNLYLPAADMIGKTLHETLPLPIADLLLNGIEDCLATAQTIDLEYSLPIRNQTVWLLARISPLFEDSAIIVARDITIRKQVEAALRHSEAHNRALLEAIPDLLMRIDHQGYYLDYKAPHNFKDFYEGDRIGKHLSEVLPAELAQQQLDLVQRVLETGKTQLSEQQFKVGNETFYEEIRAVPIELNAVLLMIRDVSDRRRAAAALQQAKETAEVANRTKSEFLANMSHELRTPLNAILGFTQLTMCESSLNQTASQYLEIINRSSEHLLTLINDVLEMSKIEAGRASLNVTSFDLHYLLKSLEDMLRLRAESKGLNLICDCAPDVPQYLQADEGKLRQILINILGNAIKFTTEGGVALRVGLRKGGHQAVEKWSCERVAQFPIPPPVTLYFEIEDTGLGITADELENLFEPFMQARREQTSQEGTGLGLPISRSFVRLMGGDIQIHSVVGQGTIVQFEIQADWVPVVEPKYPHSKLTAIALVPEQPNYRILVVEDNASNRELLTCLLRSFNFDVQAATNGQEALSLWQIWQPHLIWMDMRMPVMDGYEATKQIRIMEAQSAGDGQQSQQRVSPASHKFTDTPQPTFIIALTASAFAEDRDRVLAAGCDDFVSKPFRKTVILEKMAAYLKVQYVYEESEVESQTLGDNQTDTEEKEKTKDSKSLYANFSQTGSNLHPSTLQQMPVEWIEALQKAAIRGSDQRLLQLIEQIPATQTALAAVLSRWANNFQFNQILDFIQRGHKVFE